MCSNSNLCKYKYAILWVSSKAKQPLPYSFYNGIDKFFKYFKKETKKSAKDGLLDEHEADPISWTLFYVILQWSLEKVSILIWVFSVLHWNCMEWSINTGALAYHKFQTGDDYIKIRYNKKNSDQAGKNVRDKHVYANPFNPLCCPILALGVWFSLESTCFGTNTSLFGSSNTEEEAPSKRYTSLLKLLLKTNIETVSKFIWRNHANGHVIWKGLASFATSGTTCPPSVASVAAWGEWSMGAVLYVYWHFCVPEDHFIGRLLSGLDPNKPEFASLPPHFMTGFDPMEYPDISEAMHLMYGPILEQWSGNKEVDPTGLFLFVFALVIYHSKWLQNWITVQPGHPFCLMLFLNNPKLLIRLKLKITVDLVGQCKHATGIPPHIENACLCAKMLWLFEETLTTVKALMIQVKEAVKDAFEEKVE